MRDINDINDDYDDDDDDDDINDDDDDDDDNDNVILLLMIMIMIYFIRNECNSFDLQNDLGASTSKPTPQVHSASYCPCDPPSVSAGSKTTNSANGGPTCPWPCPWPV